MPAVLSSDAPERYHLLLVDDTVTPTALEGLARSRFPYAGRLDSHTIALTAQAQLTGPWLMTPAQVELIAAPPWVRAVYTAHVPPVRAGALPAALTGLDPLQDAYPAAVPAGLELEVLTFLRATARRVGGALRLADTTMLLVPDPEDAVDLTVFAPRALSLAATTRMFPTFQVGYRSRSTWEGTMPTTSGVLALSASRLPVPPLALSGFEWADAAPRAHAVRWRPPQEIGSSRRVRRTVIEHVEWVASQIAGAVDGVILDDDGFLVEL